MIEKSLKATIFLKDEVLYLNAVDDRGNKVLKEDVKYFFINEIKNLRQDVIDHIRQMIGIGLNIENVEDNFLNIVIEDIS